MTYKVQMQVNVKEHCVCILSPSTSTIIVSSYEYIYMLENNGTTMSWTCAVEIIK
jgi:hypothetical protein